MLIIVYILLLTAAFTWLIRRMIKHRSVILTDNELIIAFGVKIAAAAIYGYIFYRFFGGDDTWNYFQQGLQEKKLLLEQPRLFLMDLNPLLPFQKHETFGSGLRNLLDDWEYFLLMKPQAFFNLLSGDHYYINIVFFSFITFWGHYWFFALLVKLFPQQRRTWYFLVFLFPPVVFWLSGLRGDALLFFFIALMLYQGYRWMKEKRPSALIWAIMAFIGALSMRDAMALILVPALLSAYLTIKYGWKPWKVWTSVYVAGLVLFFGIAFIIPQIDPPKLVVDKQAEFFSLHGNTRFALDTLQTNAASFLKVLPQAAVNVLFRPAPWEAKGAMQLAFSLDQYLFWGLVLMACFYKRENWKHRFSHPFLLFLLLSGIGLCLFIGFTVPFPGAIVRYKIIPELFLYCWILYTHDKKLHI